MQSTPKVSVLIPTYNYAHVLDETIQSVLDQTFTDFELIIVDDRSKDNTDEVILKYLSDPRVSYYKNANNLGSMGNWNKCLEYAKGTYIKYLCADDKLHPQMLQKYVAIMDQHPAVSIITCHKQEFGDSTRLITIPKSGLQKGKEIIYLTMKHYNWLGEPSLVMFRKSDLQKVGPFKNYVWIIDWEMWVRLLNVGDCYIVPETLCYIRRHNKQVTKLVFKNLVSRSEEYYFFKAIQQGKYHIDFTSQQQKDIEGFVKKKAERCAKDMYLVMPKAWKRENWNSFYAMFKIAGREKVLFTPLTRKMVKAKS